MYRDNEGDESYYRRLFEEMNFSICPPPEGFPREGQCWSLASVAGDGYYWIYDAGGRYNIKIHDFWFREDTVLDMRIPEALSVTWYESISGEELNPYRKLNCHVVKSFLGGYEPFRALIHRNIPIRSIGIEYRPAYYESYLKEQFGDLYQSPADAFRSIDETADFPEMIRLLKELWHYQGEGLPATLYYDAKAAEALSLIFERHKKLNERKPPRISQADRTMLQILASYIGDHYADSLSIDMLARIACMGTTKLKRCFRDYFDCTVADYIQRVRIDQAEHLLAYTDLPIGEVAKAVGYTAAGHFSELFRRMKGTLPLEYRKMMQERKASLPITAASCAVPPRTEETDRRAEYQTPSDSRSGLPGSGGRQPGRKPPARRR